MLNLDYIVGRQMRFEICDTADQIASIFEDYFERQMDEIDIDGICMIIKDRLIEIYGI